MTKPYGIACVCGVFVCEPNVPTRIVKPENHPQQLTPPCEESSLINIINVLMKI